jgi:hypothetical protein
MRFICRNGEGDADNGETNGRDGEAQCVFGYRT